MTMAFPQLKPEPARTFRIALAGNPNSGKTTVFNALTGSRYKVANYPGVTVEKREGALSLDSGVEVSLIDLPGIYSLSSLSLDERIATEVLSGVHAAKPDALIAVLDATNLERNLYLACQLIDREFPLIIALNMSDLAAQRGIAIYRELLARALDVPVVSLVASAGKGIDELKRELEKILLTPRRSGKVLAWLAEDDPYRRAAIKVGRRSAPEEKLSEGEAFLRGSDMIAETIVTADVNLQPVRSALEARGIDPYSYEATKRYLWINSIVKSCSVSARTNPASFSNRCDAIVTHPVWGVLFFALTMGVVFQAIFLWSEIPMGWIETVFGSLGQLVGAYLPEGHVRSLIVDGVIGGVGSVVVFVPQIAVLFLFLSLLEDSGYLARAAFMMDRVLRPIGLQGRSFIPLLSSFACAIPGILASRTIPSWSDRLATIFVAPLMSCSARLPVYTVLIGAAVPAISVGGFLSLPGLVLFGMYLLGIMGAALLSLVLKRTVFRGSPALFVMELPPFRTPSLRVVLREVLDRVLGFLRSAGTVILACTILLWFLASFPQHESGREGVRQSYAGQIGSLVEPVIRPLGFNWEIGVGILASFAAREVFVSSLATVYNLQDDGASSESLISLLQHRHRTGEFSTATALSLTVFYVFACQCISTLAVCRRETGSWAWPALMFLSMTAMAYSASFVTYRLVLVSGGGVSLP